MRHPIFGMNFQIDFLHLILMVFPQSYYFAPYLIPPPNVLALTDLCSRPLAAVLLLLLLHHHHLLLIIIIFISDFGT